jgi:hypothetical protein
MAIGDVSEHANTTRIMARHSVTLVLALVISGIALVACGSENRAKPGDKVSLIFAGKSNSEYFFVLENPTSQTIYFRSTKWLWFAPTPLDTGFDCKNANTGEAMVGGSIALFDSVTGRKDPPPTTLSPGKAIKIGVVGHNLADHKGEACQLHLTLLLPRTMQLGGETVESQVFEF